MPSTNSIQKTKILTRKIPLVPVDGPHTLWVALVYAVIFATVALVLTWKRDVKE